MVLDQATTQKILKALEERPKAINELATILKVNWRTADRYVDRLKSETGKIDTATFREGTRGALKIVFLKEAKLSSPSKAKDAILEKIRLSASREDFTPHTIYKRVAPEKKEAFQETVQKPKSVSHAYNIDSFCEIVRSAKTSLFVFGGSMQWAEELTARKKLVSAFKDVLAKGIAIKMLLYVSFHNLGFAKEITSLKGLDAIHCRQPLRGFIVDSKKAILLECLPVYENGKLADKNRIMYYKFTDQEWVDWLTDIFWFNFNRDIPATQKIHNLDSIPQFSVQKI